MHQDLTFDRTTDAYGRNRWFHLDNGALFGEGIYRWLDLNSKVRSRTAPITLRFAGPDDMRTLGRALLEMAEAWEAQRPATERLSPSDTQLGQMAAAQPPLV